MRHVRTHENYNFRIEDVYDNDKLKFTIRISYSSEYEDGGDRMEESLDSVTAHFDLKGENPKRAYLRMQYGEEYVKRMEQKDSPLQKAKEARKNRDHDILWAERVKCARLLVLQGHKKAAGIIIKDYLQNQK